MRIRSLAHRTDLMLVGWDGQIEDRGAYVVAATPTSPRFYHGNFLLFDRAPDPSAIVDWPALFAHEFAGEPEVRHRCFRWAFEGALGAVEAFVDAGYEIDRTIALTTDSPRPAAHLDREATIRALEGDADWAAARELQVQLARERFGDGSWQALQMHRYRRLVDAGRGAWLGAFVGAELVADLGIFCGDGTARFQAVETHPSFRRRGLCGMLVHAASRLAIESFGARVLVIVADPEGDARRVYESIGFGVTDEQVSLWHHGS